MDKSSPLFAYFPDQIYAIAIPSVLLVLAISVVALFMGYVIIKESRKTKTQ